MAFLNQHYVNHWSSSKISRPSPAFSFFMKSNEKDDLQDQSMKDELLKQILDAVASLNMIMVGINKAVH